MNAVGIFFLVLIFCVLLPVGAWIGYTRWRAHQQGLPPPALASYIPFYQGSSSQTAYPIAPRPGGITGWVQDKYQSLKNRGTGLGGSSGYDGTAARGARGGFSQLDPDGAWDDRVGHEADSHGRIGDYEEQELGLHPTTTPYGGTTAYGGYGGAVRSANYDDEPRGRSRSRDDGGVYDGDAQRGLDQRYDEEMEVHDSRSERANPFGDEAESSDIRAVSPRPVEMDATASPATHTDRLGHKKKNSDDTHTSSRKSMFQEGL